MHTHIHTFGGSADPEPTLDQAALRVIGERMAADFENYLQHVDDMPPDVAAIVKAYGPAAILEMVGNYLARQILVHALAADPELAAKLDALAANYPEPTDAPAPGRVFH